MPPPPSPLVGAWRVIGCDTSPEDPAPCAHGNIVFTEDHVTVDVPWCEIKDQAYSVLASEADHVTVRVAGRRSVIHLLRDGLTRWSPCTTGRVGELSFVRR